MLDSSSITLYNPHYPLWVYAIHAGNYTHIHTPITQRVTLVTSHNKRILMLLPVTNEQHESIYINTKYIVSLKPLENGTVINLITETLTVHETIEHILISC